MRNKDFDGFIRLVVEKEDLSIPDKVLTASDAVAKFIKPGMKLHLGVTHVMPYGLCNQVTRQFWGKSPGFSLIALGSVQPVIVMLHGGLVKRLITSYAGDIYPAPSPNRIVNQAYTSRSVEFEHWSLLTQALRLKAAAMGVPYLPTRSLAGSSMEQANTGHLTVFQDPQDPDQKLALVHALYPDITIIHGLAADRAGNTIFSPPYSEGLWGAYAAREGVIVSVERIVSSETIREYSHLVKLPGSYVKAVCEMPFGGHPGGLSNRGFPEMDSYAEDYDFIVDFRRATKSDETMNDWVNKWILTPKHQNDYIRLLGDDKLKYLLDKGKPDFWEDEFPRLAEEYIDPGKPCNSMEMMTISAARIIADLVKSNNYRTILAGIGNSNLAAWLAKYWLSAESYPIDLVAEVGFYGYHPRPGDPFIFNFANIPTCSALGDSFEALGIYAGGSNNRCLGSLGAGQVDRHGNINSTMIPGFYHLLGSGGANDVMSAACQVVLTVPQDRIRYVEKVPYITAQGLKVTHLISNLGVFEKPPGDGEFRLVAYFDINKTGDERSIVEKIKADCGWELKISGNLKVVPQPSKQEIWLLRAMDPRKAFIGNN